MFFFDVLGPIVKNQVLRKMYGAHIVTVKVDVEFDRCGSVAKVPVDLSVGKRKCCWVDR